MSKPQKTLGQIAYEASDGPKSFGTWDEAPQCVRDVHENISAAVKKAMLADSKKKVVWFYDTLGAVAEPPRQAEVFAEWERSIVIQDWSSKRLVIVPQENLFATRNEALDVAEKRARRALTRIETSRSLT